MFDALEHGQVSDVVLLLRLLALVDAGTLEGTGRMTSMRDTKVRRRAT
jgi:hypothetical protein